MADSFLFYRSYWESIQALGNEKEQIELFKAICTYALDGEYYESDLRYMNALFKAYQIAIDKSFQRREQNRINGSGGGAPEGNQNAVKPKQKQPKSTENNQNQPKSTDRIKDYDYEGDYETEKEKEGDTERGLRGRSQQKNDEPIQGLRSTDVNQIAQDLGIDPEEAEQEYVTLLQNDFYSGKDRLDTRSDFIYWLKARFNLFSK